MINIILYVKNSIRRWLISQALMLKKFLKNSVPAIVFACFVLDKETTVFVSPSEHLVKGAKIFSFSEIFL